MISTTQDIRQLVVGTDTKVKLLDGSMSEYIFFDNGASTPSLRPVLDKVNEFMEWYSAVHRGNGIKSFVASEAYDDAHKIIAEFLKAPLDKYHLVMVKNATEAINKLSYRMGLDQDDMVLISGMEHHSNDLPWRRFNQYCFLKTDDYGYLDLNDLEEKAKKYQGKLKLVAVTGASNVSGIVNPIHDIAEIAHKYGASILVDAAQLAPHRSISMIDYNNPKRSIDYLVLSAHKMYAPYGTGVLVCKKTLCEKGNPEYVGGGVAKVVTTDSVHWNDGSDREEAGSPNTVGAIALAEAAKFLTEYGMENIAQHEEEMLRHIVGRFNEIPQVKLLSPIKDDNYSDRLGVVTFTFDGVYYQKLASILCYEFGIGLRAGRFCSHPYTSKLLGVEDSDSSDWVQDILNNRKQVLPGAVRVSFGLYNNTVEIDKLINALKLIAKGEYQGNYVQNESTGEYFPLNYSFNKEDYFKL